MTFKTGHAPVPQEHRLFNTKKIVNAGNLTPQQELFCQEYIKDLNGARAAFAAGYSQKKPVNARVTAAGLLTRVNVNARLSDLMAARKTRCQITADEVLLELKRVAFSDIKRQVAWGPGGVLLKDSSQLTDTDSACVSSVSETKSRSGNQVQFKLYDKVKALELLAKHLDLFTEHIDHTTKGQEIKAAPVFQIIDEKTQALCNKLLAGEGRESQGGTDATGTD